jgi:hypothetical protein
LPEDLGNPSLLRLEVSSVVLHGENILLFVCFFCKLLLSKPLFFSFFVWVLIYISFGMDGVGVCIAMHFLALKTNGMQSSSLVVDKNSRFCR